MEDQPPQPHESTWMPTEDRWRRLDGDGTDVGGEEESLEKLEEEVKEMAQKLVHYRSTFPGQLKAITARILAAQRPELPDSNVGSQPGPSGNPGAGLHVDASEVVSTAEDHETADKLHLLRDKISTNVSATPIVLKRLNDCISRIDKLSSCHEINPIFKRRKNR
ncbi:hypothetical protein Dimus_025270 [Dionaea muscipula]